MSPRRRLDDEVLEQVLRERASAPNPFVLDEILREVEATPQDPRRWGLEGISGSPPGSVPVPVLVLLLMLTLAAAAVVVGALTRLPENELVLAPDVPEELEHPWLGDETIFEFRPHEATLSFGDRLESRVVEFGPDRFTVVLADDESGCAAGDRGTYGWSLSPASDELTLDPVGDECEARASALPGTWTRSDCPLFPDDFCLGDLEPGTHRSSYFDPFTPIDEWQFAPGAMTYTVPEGWANSGDYPDIYTLTPIGADSSQTGILMSSAISVASDASPCTATPNESVARTDDAITSWLISRDGLGATDPVEVNVGGLDGVALDLVVESDDAAICVGDGRRYLPLFTGATTGGLQWGIGINQRIRAYVLDLPDGRALVILSESPDDASYDAFLTEATAIVESIRFRSAE
jgi:hypothetical protein